MCMPKAFPRSCGPEARQCSPKWSVRSRKGSGPGSTCDELLELSELSCSAAHGSEMAGQFPLYAMRVVDFVKLQHLEPHQTLVAAGLLVPLDLEGEHAQSQVHFISHQWLGQREPDPDGVHLRTLQEAFRKVMDGENIFRSEEDRHAYMRGFTKENLRRQEEGCHTVLGDDFSELRSEEEFASSVRGGWVWMDYLSVPQADVPGDDIDPVAVAIAQSRAVASIPVYVQHARHFWVCAPCGATHKERGTVCDLHTWQRRGWCRMEELVFHIQKLGDVRPLFLAQRVGEPVQVRTLDSIDRTWNYTQRHTAVLTGDFSCCHRGHQAVRADGTVEQLPCDKEHLRHLLARLYDEKTAWLRQRLQSREGHLREVCLWHRLNESMSHKRVFWDYFAFTALRPIVLADTVYEDEGLCERSSGSRSAAESTGHASAAESIGHASAAESTDHAPACHPMEGRLSDVPEEAASSPNDGHSSSPPAMVERDSSVVDAEGYVAFLARFDLDPSTTPLDQGAWCAACLGELSVYRYAVEVEGASVTAKNSFGMSALLMASRFGHVSVLRYIAERAGPAEVNFLSPGLGLSALGDASKCGHPRAIRALLELGASTASVRTNGRTPLHEAAAGGFVECVRVLLDGGADPDAVDNGGRTPLQLAALEVPSAHVNEQMREAFRRVERQRLIFAE